MWNQNRQKIKNSTVSIGRIKIQSLKWLCIMQNVKIWQMKLHKRHFFNYIFQLYIYFENVNLDNVYPWLVTTARNFTFNYNRDKKREILGEVFEVLKETKDKFCNINNMEEYYLRTEQKRRAEELEDSIFECLYKDHRIWYDAVTQVYCFGKSQQEAAEQLGIAVEVLNSRLYRARQWIRKNYENEYREVVSWF